jgi:hypothetical protein
MAAFMQFLYWLEHLNGCVDWKGGNPEYISGPIVYGGNCLQAGLMAMQSHGTIFWGQVR